MVQRRAALFVFNKYSRQDSVSTLLTNLGWPTLTSLRERERLCMMYKVLNNSTGIISNNYVTFSETVTRRVSNSPFILEQLQNGMIYQIL